MAWYLLPCGDRAPTVEQPLLGSQRQNAGLEEALRRAVPDFDGEEALEALHSGHEHGVIVAHLRALPK